MTKKEEPRFSAWILWDDEEEDGFKVELEYYTDRENADEMDIIRRNKKSKKNKSRTDDELDGEDFRKFGKNLMLMSIKNWENLTAETLYGELIDPGENTSFSFEDDEEMTVKFSIENRRELVGAVSGPFAEWFSVCRDVLKTQLKEKRLADLKNLRKSVGGGETKAKM